MKKTENMCEAFTRAHDLYHDIFYGADVDIKNVESTLEGVRNIFENFKKTEEHLRWDKMFCAHRHIEISRLLSKAKFSGKGYFDPDVDYKENLGKGKSAKRTPWEFMSYQANRV